ncbi:hypothetical protein [Actinokineospora inagensis]|uniref:hypothetical protein n=1 Tax=Actinokineospora inagensis TaxID=103730 RepID=UPI0003FF9DDE|nr:hypothetical protein [Actinokineospora inagensis]
MDPTQALVSIRELCRDNPDADFDDFDQLRELVTALDEWMTRQEHPPAQWTR